MSEDDGGERLRRARERTLTHKTYRPLTSPFEASVVGVSFTPHYPENLQVLVEHQQMAELQGERLAAIIIRDPDNEYDPNACEVHVPALGKHSMVGHLTRPIAVRLAAELDTDVRWQGEVVWVRLNPAYEDRPGITINLKRI